MGKGRLEAFSDGVLAIIITIMVLEMEALQGAELGALRPLVRWVFGLPEQRSLAAHSFAQAAVEVLKPGRGFRVGGVSIQAWKQLCSRSVEQGELQMSEETIYDRFAPHAESSGEAEYSAPALDRGTGGGASVSRQ